MFVQYILGHWERLIESGISVQGQRDSAIVRFLSRRTAGPDRNVILMRYTF